MKRRDFKKLALIGMTSGFIVTAADLPADEKIECNSEIAATKHKCGKGKCGGIVAERETKKKTILDEANVQNMNYHLMTEQELLDELNDQGQRLYKGLSAEGKKMALQVASNGCQGTNGCAGENACQTEANACAGKGACKGKGKCAFADKNLAVKIVAEKMAKKRSNASK